MGFESALTELKNGWKMRRDVWLPGVHLVMLSPKTGDRWLGLVIGSAPPLFWGPDQADLLAMDWERPPSA